MITFTTGEPAPKPCECGNTMPGVAHVCFLGEYIYFVNCACGKEGPVRSSHTQAVEAWNRKRRENEKR